MRMSDRDLIFLDDVRDIPTSESPDAPEPHSWQPQSLVEMAANPPEPPVIGGLLYPGQRTVLSGETESMKTWMALILCKAEMDLGLPVCWCDLDAMGPGAMYERLTLLGCSPSAVHELFLYYQPSEMIDMQKLTEVSALVADRGARLFVIDAFNPFLSMHGLEPNSTPDIDTFWRTIADPICRAGAAPVMLDHVVKNSEARGKYAYGSERKASGAIVHLGFRLLEPLVKGGKGRTLLTVHKDRPGYLPRPTLGRLILVSDGYSISFELEADHAHDLGGFRPTIMMEKASKHLETQNEPLSKNKTEEYVGGNKEARAKAIELLLADGYIRETAGDRGARLLTTVRPFREAEQPLDSDLPPPPPDFPRNLRSSHLPHLPPPLRGERGRGDLGGEVRSTSPEGSEVIHEYDYPPDIYLESIAEPEFPAEEEKPADGKELW